MIFIQYNIYFKPQEIDDLILILSLPHSNVDIMLNKYHIAFLIFIGYVIVRSSQKNCDQKTLRIY